MTRKRISSEALAREVPSLSGEQLASVMPLLADGGILERDASGIWLILDESIGRIALKVAPRPTEDAAVAPVGFGCATELVLRDSSVESQTVFDAQRLRWVSKYAYGSTVVQVVFLAGPKIGWTQSRKDRMLRIAQDGHWLFNHLAPHASEPTPKLNFMEIEGPISSHPSVEPVHYDTEKEWALHYRHVRSFLKNVGRYSGDVMRSDDPASDPAFQQALFLHLNALRRLHKKDWANVMFVYPDDGSSGANAPTARAFAFQDHGYYLMMERGRDSEKNQGGVHHHETGHMYGAADEYTKDETTDPTAVPNCKVRRAGLYPTVNSNCGPGTAAEQCLMRKNYPGESGYQKLCAVSGKQMGLIPDGGTLKPLNDVALQTYSFPDNGYFRNEAGIFLKSGAFREGSRITVRASGWSRLAWGWTPHGPDGDGNTHGNDKFLLPGQPYNAVVGRWMSIDGKQFSSWFRVGSGGSFGPLPWDGYFVFAVNDERGHFGDNEGAMEVSISASLRDCMGEPVIHPFAADVVASDVEAVTRIVAGADVEGILTSRSAPVPAPAESTEYA